MIALSERDIQAVEQAVIDRDGESALHFLARVIRPKVEAALDKGHCKPIFEWGGSDPGVIQPPSRQKNHGQQKGKG